MAHLNGVAADAPAYMAALVDFLTTGALAAEGHAWSKAWESADGKEFVMQGEGTVGGNPVYVGFRKDFNDATRTYLLFIRGMTGVNVGAVTLADHVGISGEVAMFLDGEPIGYWFVANGRRIILVAQL